MNINIKDKIVSVLTYSSFGFFGLLWLIYSAIAKKTISGFSRFNIFQSIFISVILALISLVYSIAIDFISIIPILGKLAKTFDIFFNSTPIYFGTTLSGLIVSIFICYLSVLAVLGKKPFVPYVSSVVQSNFGG